MNIQEIYLYLVSFETLEIKAERGETFLIITEPNTVDTWKLDVKKYDVNFTITTTNNFETAVNQYLEENNIEI